MLKSYEPTFIGVVLSENLPWTHKPGRESARRESDICSTVRPILDRCSGTIYGIHTFTIDRHHSLLDFTISGIAVTLASLI